MADQNTSLPIRSEADLLDERVLIKVQDGANPSGANETMTVSENKAHVRVHGKDSDSVDQEILLSQEGHVQSNGDYDATNNKRPSSQGLIVSDRDASPSEITMNKRPTAVDGDNNKTAVDVAISDSDGNHIGEDNPLAVYLAESPAVEVDDFDEAVDVAKDATSNHDYTVSASVSFKSIEVYAASSGKMKTELQIEDGVGAGTFTTVAVGFNSTAKPEIELKYKKAVAAGIIVRLVKTNRDNQAQSLYSQIKGLEI